MNQAIENHINEHMQDMQNPLNEEQADQLRQELIRQIFEKASRHN